ncbi:bacterio-opsin activator domain-containing protein [Halosimplex pelagicum]|uniref:Helix-turn-helix domain-containing protein n=1 Tax=Halosimplex pelagicum TaxID=869886 RepID=A0A7D5PAN2_9EURY|nr:bacterio-opsin activator domain-containing protein [Halosimplex pelagicum]QLH81905.1 helix-turn-helix domain-containing protein [Halosimplex pelagicum]
MAAPAEQPTELEFRVTSSDYAFVSGSERGSCRWILRELLPRSDGEFLEFFEVRDASPATVDRISDAEPVEERLVDRHTENGVLVCRIEEPADCVATTLADEEAFLRDLWAEAGDGRVVAEVLPSREAGAVVDSFTDRHPSVDLVAKRDRPREGPLFLRHQVQDVLARELTDRQLEVLVTAYRAGYFQRPRETTGAEVAADLDISPSTLSQHLRAAQRKLLGALFEECGPAAGHRIDVE